MSNEYAPDGYVYQCQACGKMSHDKYGSHKVHRGYDTSCAINSKLEKRDVAELRLKILITKEQMDRFVLELLRLEGLEPEPGVHPRLHVARMDATQSQLESLKEELTQLERQLETKT